MLPFYLSSETQRGRLYQIQEELKYILLDAQRIKIDVDIK